MTGRAVRAGAAPMTPATTATWALIVVVGVGLWASTAAWLAGQAGTWWHTRLWAKTDWSTTLILDTLTAPAATWPKAATAGVWLLTGLLTVVPLLLIGTLVGRWWLHRPFSDGPHRSLATAHQLQALTLGQRRQAARRLRRSLADTKTSAIAAGDAGIALGRLDRGPGGTGPLLLAGWEDVIVAVMAPRQGKTSCLVVPTILAAPGAVVATSNKTDILDTAALRRQLTGQQVWIFDPQAVAHTRQAMWWNPLAGVDGVEAAERLAGHFLIGVRSDKDPTWHSAATELLGGLFLAAALDGLPIGRVYQWLHTEASSEAPAILRRHGFPDTAASLLGLGQLPDETRGSVFFTARAGAACLRNPEITAWVTPSDDLPRFDPSTFVGTRETLYLLSKDGGGSAAPLTTAFADAVIRAGERAGTAAGGRLDPPLTMTLDEAANVVRIKDLPELASHAGSRGVIVMVILQSFPQGERVWDDGGMKALWSAATIKLVGPGQDDDKFLDGVSKLVGEHWVTTSGHSISHGGRHGGSTSSSTSTTRQRIMDPGALRAMPFGSALLIPAAAPPALLTLQPAYTGPHREALAVAAVDLRERVAANAGPGDAMNVDELAIAEILDRLVAVESFVHDLTVAAAEAAEAVDDLGDEDLVDLTTPTTSATASAASTANARFTDVVPWVDRVLAPLWSGELPWCRKWWAHAEVYERLTWLWRSWEAAMAAQAKDDTAMAGWLRQADAHRTVVQARGGPFASCTPERHGTTAPWLPVTVRQLTTTTPSPPAVIADPPDTQAAERRRLATHYDED